MHVFIWMRTKIEMKLIVILCTFRGRKTSRQIESFY